MWKDRPMRSSRKFCTWACLFALPFLSNAPLKAGPARDGSVLRQALRGAWTDAQSVRYAAPADDPQWRATQALMSRLLWGERSAQVQALASELGWSLREGSSGGRRWTVLAERPERRSGRGLYAFADTPGQHAIQAPHVPSDLYTGEIAVALGEQGNLRAIAWNTVHRREADLPHLDNSAMHAFSRAFAAQYAQERIVQLHGFDAERADRVGEGQRGAILSSTQRTPPPAVRSLAQCLREHVEPGTRLFGVDADRLGGTRNRIAGELLASGFTGFLHLEMGLDLRKSLRDDPQRRSALLNCLGVPT